MNPEMETPKTMAVMPGLTTQQMSECEFLVRVDIYEGAVFTNYDAARRYAKGARFALECVPDGRFTKVTVTAIDENGREIKKEQIY